MDSMKHDLKDFLPFFTYEDCFLSLQYLLLMSLLLGAGISEGKKVCVQVFYKLMFSFILSSVSS